MTNTRNDGAENFRMYGARTILEDSQKAIQIRHQVDAIEEAVRKSPPLVFDLAKGLVETVCKTILNDLSVPIGAAPDLPELFGKCLNTVRLFPSGYHDPKGVTGRLRKLANGLRTIVQGLCELRSSDGVAAHGRDAYEPVLSGPQAILAASAADSVVAFLWNCHRRFDEPPSYKRGRFEDFAQFNDFLDDCHELIQILSYSYAPSEVLFAVDKEAYWESCLQFQSTDGDQHSEE